MDSKKDEVTRIQEIKNKIKVFVSQRAWEKYHNPKDLAMSIGIEAAEIMELFQWRNKDEIEKLIETSIKYAEQIEEELADIIIYAFSLSNTLNIDVAKIVENKIKFNEEKYPADKYYGKF